MGCLYSTQHFNAGMPLPAGQTQATLGIGRLPVWSCSEYQVDSTRPEHVCGEAGYPSERVKKKDAMKGSFDYRLGVRDHLGPFPAVEVEWRVEAPTHPVTMEFAMNLALPSRPTYHHALGAGWGIGAWAGNSFFLEYAVSVPLVRWARLGLPLLFANLRATSLSAQIDEVLDDEFSAPLPSSRRLIAQAGAGARFQLPAWPVVPDFLIPQFNVTLPQIPAGEQKFRRQDIPFAQWDLNFGFGWAF